MAIRAKREPLSEGQGFNPAVKGSLDDNARPQIHTGNLHLIPRAHQIPRLAILNPNDPTTLFVYGTLHPDHAPEELRPTIAQFQYIGTGTITGELLDLGGYPGVILHGKQNTIDGTVFSLPEDILPTLDAYEGFDPNDPAKSLFRREPITVTMDNGDKQTHWIYTTRHDRE